MINEPSEHLTGSKQLLLLCPIIDRVSQIPKSTQVCLSHRSESGYKMAEHIVHKISRPKKLGLEKIIPIRYVNRRGALEHSQEISDSRGQLTGIHQYSSDDVWTHSAT
jgi:hypothetical protein